MRRIVGSAPLIAFLSVIAGAGAANAHGSRLPIEKWGGFSAGAVRCQRAIAGAAARCASHAWETRRACRAAELVAQPCDETATTAAIEAVRRAALDAVDAACSERQAIELQYLGSFDLEADVNSFCRAWEQAADSAVFGPPARSGLSGAAEQSCALAAADAATDVMQLAFRIRRQCMDRIAATALDAPNRMPVLDLAAHRMGEATDAVTSRLADRCGMAAFTTLYGRPPADFVEGLGQRADCIGGSFYIQTAVLCADPVCGNGIVEPGEDCDDGNTQDGDTCPATCLQ